MVPQDTHLGPHLFILFINDLSTMFDSSVDILLFVDDAKMFSVIKSISDGFKL